MLFLQNCAVVAPVIGRAGIPPTSCNYSMMQKLEKCLVRGASERAPPISFINNCHGRVVPDKRCAVVSSMFGRVALQLPANFNISKLRNLNNKINARSDRRRARPCDTYIVLYNVQSVFFRLQRCNLSPFAF